MPRKPKLDVPIGECPVAGDGAAKRTFAPGYAGITRLTGAEELPASDEARKGWASTRVDALPDNPQGD